jgi:hypothetical protein
MTVLLDVVFREVALKPSLVKVLYAVLLLEIAMKKNVVMVIIISVPKIIRKEKLKSVEKKLQVAISKKPAMDGPMSAQKIFGKQLALNVVLLPINAMLQNTVLEILLIVLTILVMTLVTLISVPSLNSYVVFRKPNYPLTKVVPIL